MNMLKLREVTDQHVPRPKDTFTYKTRYRQLELFVFKAKNCYVFLVSMGEPGFKFSHTHCSSVWHNKVCFLFVRL